MKNDTVSYTLLVAFILCLVCSLIVSIPAVVLRPLQQANAKFNQQVNILLTAGLISRAERQNKPKILQQFAKIIPKVVNLNTGQFAAIDPLSFDPAVVRKDPQRSEFLKTSDDIAKIKRREFFSKVYLTYTNKLLDKVILPVRGYGLWSSLHGFVALEADLNTVAGMIFYEHAETPGLGGEVDNIAWQESWIGKKLYDETGKLSLQLVKGGVDPSSNQADYQIDALSGASLTSRGINNIFKFWFSSKGFKHFLTGLKMEMGA